MNTHTQTFNVTVLHPVDEGKNFQPHEPGTPMKEAFSFEMDVQVSDDDDIKSIQRNVLNRVFMLTNRGSGQELPEFYHAPVRSTSVGDVVIIAEFESAHACGRWGWDVVRLPEIVHYPTT